MPGQIDFKNLDIPFGPSLHIGGRKYLYFGGTAYLGIPRNQDFLDRYIEGIRLYGLNNGTSRSNNIQLGIYNEVETYAAVKFKAAAALITSSGFLAAQLAIKQLASVGQISYAPETHPALWHAGPPKSLGSFEQWADHTVEQINASDQQNWLLISNSMNNLYPERYDFSFMERIDAKKELILLVDDSHGIGLNNNGTSALSAIKAPKNVKVLLVASMAKALGVDAGIILGDNSLIAEIKGSEAFIGASPPSAAGLHAFMHTEKIYKEEREKLLTLTASLARALAGKADWHFITDFPVFSCKNADLSEKLLRQKILVSAFPYPNKESDKVSRVVLSSWHEESGLMKLITILNRI